MGAKDRAKAAAAAADVPLIPGYQGGHQDEAGLLEAAHDLGFPVLLKAVAGGGGKGMRVVARADDFAPALEGARREALAAFGDERMLLERYLAAPRHIEVQVFGDHQGNVVHLFERDCSVQRRHQKVLEEAPAPALSREQRGARRRGVRVAAAIGYANAGTVEFLMDEQGAFYFMEMNTRLQVEHPVTEMVTGLDLVEWQLRVAAGEPLPLTQQQITLSGHAIEARLYAEDPERASCRPPDARPPPAASDRALRIETGVAAGDRVSPFYDPMLAKIVAWGPDRAAALRRLRAALGETEIVGPATNLEFLATVLRCDAFQDGAVTTSFVEDNAAELLAPAPPPTSGARHRQPVAALPAAPAAAAAAAASADPHSPWHRVDGWRLNDVGHQTLRLRAGDEPVAIDAQADGAGWRLRIGARELRGSASSPTMAGSRSSSTASAGARAWSRSAISCTCSRRLAGFQVQRIDPLAIAAAEDELGDVLTAPMPGKIVRQLIAAGDRVGAARRCSCSRR